MPSISQKILFFGTEDFSALSLQALIDANFSIAAVITKPDTRKGRGQKIIAPQVKTIAEMHSIPVWQPTQLTDITENIIASQAEAGVLVSFGKIIPQSIINLFPAGIINVHPSLLPLYRGPSPIESAIKNGDNETGISIMQLSAKMDAGPIYRQDRYTLSGNETQPGLYIELGQHGAEILTSILPSILDGTLTPTPQDETNASYCQLLSKDDAWLQPAHHTAAELERLIRAHLTFPRSKIVSGKHTLIVTSARTGHDRVTQLDLLCRNNTYLIIDEVVAPSGKKMNAEAFIRGYIA